MNTSSTLLEDSLLAIWNNRDSATRLTLMEKIYARNIAFYESDNSTPFIGYGAIDALIGKLQGDWSADFEFRLAKRAQTNHNIQLINWVLGPAGQAPVAGGADVAIIENNKIVSLYLFLDAGSHEE